MIRAVSILPGHGERDGRWDTGALSPAGWDEAWLVRRIAAAMWLETQRRQLGSEIVAAGTYHQRGQDADAGLGSRLVVQLHADAAPAEQGPDLARVFYWPTEAGEPPGKHPAEVLAERLGQAVPWPVEVLAATEAWPGPRACLAAVRATSVLLEVGFTDGAQGRTLLPSLTEQIGVALGRAV